MKISRFIGYLAAFGLTWWGSACTPRPASPGPFTPRFTAMKQPVLDVRSELEYTFGYLEVLEDRSVPAGRTLELPVYIFKSRSETPRPDPVVFTVGGPGASTMRSATFAQYYAYLDDRDLIFFEQRGTQYARPHLDCPEWYEAQAIVRDPALSSEQRQQVYSQAAAACRNRLRGKGVDLNAYTTRATAADLEDLRRALGIEQWNLLTVSYSTKIAQVLLRDYPEGIRSVVMDSPLPLEASWDEESNGNLLVTYRRIAADCARDSACAEAFPNLWERWSSFLQRISREPLEVTVPNPADPAGESRVVRIRGKDIPGLLDSDSPGAIALLPQRISTLLSGDYGLLVEGLQAIWAAEYGGSGMGARLSVWCAEETPFTTAAGVDRERTRYPELTGRSPVVFSRETCNIWGVTAEPGRENEAVQSQVPVLLLSGSYDATTPLRWAEQMLPNLVNGHQVVFPGWTHGVTTNWGNPCGMRTANAFFNDPSRRPELPCFGALEPLPFEVE